MVNFSPPRVSGIELDQQVVKPNTEVGKEQRRATVAAEETEDLKYVEPKIETKYEKPEKKLNIDAHVTEKQTQESVEEVKQEKLGKEVDELDSKERVKNYEIDQSRPS